MCQPAADVRPQTRFKTWWILVGYPVEFAARQHKEHVDALVMDALKTCPPEWISFKDLFIGQGRTTKTAHRWPMRWRSSQQNGRTQSDLKLSLSLQ
jgi:hypothetical protein